MLAAVVPVVAEERHRLSHNAEKHPEDPVTNLFSGQRRFEGYKDNKRGKQNAAVINYGAFERCLQEARKRKWVLPSL